ncbi:MAG TPA: UvrD-helicase domain-containing protein [Burkholderiaceae bacterium]|nr:UvrD-helicase domain-containing protein [Burkholderiaceae bacterium]
MSHLLANLNEPQHAAVTLPSQHALILAGAGSGKTRVLTTRIAWLVQTGQVSPAGVLAVTFTNKAAREMMHRLSAMLPINPRGMWIGTFHGLCNRLLRAHHRDAGLPQSFQILDSADQLAAIKRLLKARNVDDEKYPPRSLMHFINGCKEEGLRAKDVEIVDDYNRRFVELYAAYDEQCGREGVVDFAELLLRTYELLERDVPLREHYRARFRHILIDEFQDTNVLQYKWIKQLAGPSTSVFAVGDDDQSIYAFRGANVGNMAAFEREFRVPNLIKLEQNYRSHAHILDCANHLIRQNGNRLGKELWTDAGAGEPVRVYEAVGDQQEAQWLLEEVRSLIAEGWARADVAILYRSNAQSRVLEHALFSAGIPYRVYGGLRFFERAEIKHALAYLRLMENPDDDTSFLRVVNYPARGIGARSVEQLQDAARAQGTSLHGAVRALRQGAAAGKLASFVGLIERLRAETASMALPETVEHVVERSGLVTHYQSEKEGQDRIENLRELVNAAAAFLAEQGVGQDVPANAGVSAAAAPQAGPALTIDAETGAPVEAPGVVDADSVPQTTPLAAFLAHASLEAGDNQAAEGTDALQLMTVHAAKGLEFDAVFITGLEEGLFPHENSVQETAGLEEERRLMYVAITRARKRLYLSFSQTRMLHGQTRYNIRSRFLDELPDGCLKWLTPRTGAPRGWSGGGGWTESHWSRGDRDARGARDAVVPNVHPGDARIAAKFDRGLPWRVGQSVAHAKFGEGVILAIEGGGSDARVQVNFGRQGVKWLALSVAKLEAVG